MRRDAATERQVQAADPTANTWLGANAGSGKTRVLTDRVARLLLGGVPPGRILCLTFTKAAASEMQNKLFQRLGAWAMKPDAALRAELDVLGVDADAAGDLRAARRLFARAIETPGGLKIQTIHAFCAALLRRFPLEAGVSPQFTEMDDRATERLREEILDDMAGGAAQADFDAVAEHVSGAGLTALAKEVADNRGRFEPPKTAAAIWADFGLGDHSRESVARGVFTGGESALLETVCAALHGGSAQDVKAAKTLVAVNAKRRSFADLEALEDVLLTGPAAREPFTAKIGSFPTKATRAALGPSLDPLQELMHRVEAMRATRLALLAAEKTLALHRFAAAFLPEYEARKRARGWLDFDDLIRRTRGLMTDPGVADWVLFRLDGGIDHVLVDEAQDTSPEQWQVIDLLTREFTAGAGARGDTERTLFVVGDRKQSIYSFQGADPGGVDRMKTRFGTRLAEAGRGLQELALEHSFRSAEAILRVVDTTFPEGERDGLDREMLHVAARPDLPGRVDLWPAVPPPERPEDRLWWQPVDTPSAEHPAVVLAERIAAGLTSMIARGESIHDSATNERRPMRAGDVLILVQRRSGLFHEIIRACKAAGLPVAGADRLKIGGELAVRDLTALLAFLAMPEDDLSLASALRSPLLDWDEAELYDLAEGRETPYLWAELRRRADEFPETLGILRDLRREADFLRPHDLMERILTRHDGRRRLIARLGAEAEDGIDAALSQALAYERMEVPSLTGFLGWMESGEVEVKRQLDRAGDRIRVMTVHGAKGLEAPVVLLPDTAKRPVQLRGEILAAEDGAPLWKTPAEARPAGMAAAAERARSAEQEERSRLLYVAMTRAEQWLIVVAAGDTGGPGASWYTRVAAGLERAGAVPHPFEAGEGRRYATGEWPAPGEAARASPAEASMSLPPWAGTTPAAPPETPAPLAPSDLGGAKALPGEDAGGDEQTAKRRGRELHLLLEHLPGHDRAIWPARAAALLQESDEAPEARLAEAEAVLTAPHLSFLFGDEALAEVDVTAPLPELGGRRIRGTIDRLLVTADRVLAVDFKSNAVVPGTPGEVPEGLLRQMGAYAAALAQVYPDRPVATAILWTAGAQLMELPAEAVQAALGRAAPA